MENEKKREKIHQILDLALDINGFEERKRDVTGDKPTVFMNIFGHIAQIEVSIVEKGWCADIGETNYVSESIYFDEEYSEEQYDDFIGKLEQIKRRLADE